MDLRKEALKVHYYLIASLMIWLFLIMTFDFIGTDVHGNSDFLPSLIMLIGIIVGISGFYMIFNKEHYMKNKGYEKRTLNMIAISLMMIGFIIFMIAFTYTAVVCFS